MPSLKNFFNRYSGYRSIAMCSYLHGTFVSTRAFVLYQSQNNIHRDKKSS